MSAFNFGILAGLAFGAVSVAMMLPLEFPDKRAALLGASPPAITLMPTRSSLRGWQIRHPPI